MKKTLIILVTLSTLNYLVGCYSNERIFSGKIKTWKIKPDEYKITEVTFHDGKVIKFKSGEVTYRKIDTAISGVSKEGKEILLPLEEIREIRTEIPQSIPIEKAEGQKIEEVVTHQNRIYIFDDNGAYFSNKGTTIKGKLITGYSVIMDTNQIKEIYTSKPNIMDKSDVDKSNIADLKQVIAKYDELITFDEREPQIINNIGIISGVTDENQLVNINADDILYINTTKYDAVKTFLVIGLPLSIILTILAFSKPLSIWERWFD